MGADGIKEGVVKEFDAQRGTGVILAREGEELPVHHSAIADEGLRTLYAGDIVEF